jgi:hypothetical protein
MCCAKLGYDYKGAIVIDGKMMKGGECDEYLVGKRNFEDKEIEVCKV